MSNALTYQPSTANTLINDMPTVASTGPAFYTTLGNVYYVSSLIGTDNTSFGSTPNRPFKSINFALGLTAANNGDVIYALPGHVETVSGAAGLNFASAANADGVTVIFLGAGAERAQVNFTTSTAAQVVIAANNVTLINPKFVNAIDALVAGISVQGTDCTLINVEYFDAAAIASLIQLVTTNAGTRLTVNGYTYYEGTTGTSKTEAIRIVGGDHHRLINLNIKGSFSTANVNNVTTATTNFMGQGWFLANPLTTAVGVPLQTYVATSTFQSPDVAPQGGAAGAEYIASKLIALPQGTTGVVFTVIGGQIQILSISGFVSTVIGAVANATKLTYTPTTGGSSTDLCATVDLNAAAAGDLYLLQTSFATAAVLNTAGVESIAQVAAEKLVFPLTVAPGTLIVNCAGSDGGTGRMRWSMRYKPLSPGVLVI